MKKLVNGKIVDIDLQLFELAAEGMALNNVASSIVFEEINVDSDLINKYIGPYKAVYKSMAFPLYGIEHNLKYSTIATFIKNVQKDCGKMWIEEGQGLFILIDEENMNALKITGSTWGVVKVTQIREDNTDIGLYKYNVGYAEFNWVLDRILGKVKGENYYTEFMPSFVSACNSDPMIMKWELSNILNLGSFREDLKLRDNVIIGIESDKEFTLDIFSSGYRETKETEIVMTLDDRSPYSRAKKVRVYGYDIYEKDTATGEEGKIKKSKIVGMHNVFMTLSSIKIADDRLKMPNFNGILVNRDIVYCVEGRIFLTKAYRQGESKEIAVGVDLVGYDRGIVYMVRKTPIGKGITKESIYSYALADGTTRLCKVQFR